MMTLGRSLIITPILALSLVGAVPVGLVAQTVDAPSVASPADATARQNALNFLRRVETANEELKTLEAEFEQLRVDIHFLDEVQSNGRFWYDSTGRFRASYEARHGNEIWAFQDHIVNYLPTLKQVEIYPIPQGEDAPINQMLLGFGVKTAVIEQVFDVRAIEAEDPADFAIEFLSKDLDRSLFFRRIVIHFDRESAQPKRLKLEDDDSEITVTLKQVRLNPEIPESRFAVPTWPADVEVIDSR